MDPNIRNIQARLRYFYSQTTTRGQLLGTDTNIVVDPTMSRINARFHPRFSIDAYRPLMDFSHPNLLRAYILDYDSANIIHESYQHTLDEWMNLKEREGIHGVMSYYIPYANNHIVCYIPQEYRRIIKAMVSFIHDLHEYNYCTKGFDRSNVVLCDNKIKFWKIQFQHLTEVAKSLDYGHLHNMILGILGGGQYPIPIDMVNFLHFCGSEYACQFPMFLLNHPALMSHNMRSSFVQNLEDKKNDMGIRGPEYEYAITLMGDNRNWISRYAPRLIGPLFLVYDNGGRGQGQYVDQSLDYRDSNVSLLRLVRNQAHHLRDHSNKGKAFTEVGADIMIMDVFGDVVCNFTFALARCGILDRFTLNFE